MTITIRATVEIDVPETAPVLVTQAELDALVSGRQRTAAVLSTIREAVLVLAQRTSLSKDTTHDKHAPGLER